MEFSAEPESSCISVSGEEAVTSEENGNGFLQAHKGMDFGEEDFDLSPKWWFCWFFLEYKGFLK